MANLPWIRTIIRAKSDHSSQKHLRTLRTLRAAKTKNRNNRCITQANSQIAQRQLLKEVSQELYSHPKTSKSYSNLVLSSPRKVQIWASIWRTMGDIISFRLILEVKKSTTIRESQTMCCKSPRTLQVDRMTRNQVTLTKLSNWSKIFKVLWKPGLVLQMKRIKALWITYSTFKTVVTILKTLSLRASGRLQAAMGN